jgi:ABC-type polysaccharide transport system, permease component
MVLPGVILALIYCYLPMVGSLIAFEKFVPKKGFLSFFTSKWVGLDNYTYLINLPDFWKVMYNTVFIAIMKIVIGTVFPIIIALLLNEVGSSGLKRSVQTMIYLPYFLSWVILGGIFIDILSGEGIVNQFVKSIGLQPVFFLGDNKWFPYVMVITDVWKNFGFGTIIYLAAIAGIDLSIYEASIIDGAGYAKQALHITIPGIMPIIVLMALLSIGSLLNAGFDQILNMYNPAVYQSGDILDTFVYRIGLVNSQYSLATAVGLFKSVISTILISISYYLAYRFADYRIF